MYRHRPCTTSGMGIFSKLFMRENAVDVLDILESQHREVDDLFEAIQSGAGNRRALLIELADKLAAHATVEEKLFYPAVMAKATKELLHESVEEHLAIKRVLADLITMKLDDETFDAKITVLKEHVSHHAHREEEAKLFPKVRRLMTSDERAGLGNEVIAMFEEIIEERPFRDVPAQTAVAASLPALRRE